MFLTGIREEMQRQQVADKSEILSNELNDLFAAVDDRPGPLDIAVYNPSARVRGPVADLDPAAVLNALKVTAFGAFLVGQAATAKMLDQAPVDRQTFPRRSSWRFLFGERMKPWYQC